MKHPTINPPVVPPPPGLEREEPTFVEEEDIPSDNRTGVEDDWQSPLREDKR